MMRYLLVKQRFLVVYRAISHESSVFSVTHEPLYQENTGDEWVIPLKTPREGCISVLYNAIESTVAR